jgi:hypothetical protein
MDWRVEDGPAALAGLAEGDEVGAAGTLAGKRHVAGADDAAEQAGRARARARDADGRAGVVGPLERLTNARPEEVFRSHDDVAARLFLE